MNFFLDANVSWKAAKLLEAFDNEHQVRHLKDEFDPSVPDIEWISDLAKRDKKPHVICGDLRILRNRVECNLLNESGLNFFMLNKGWTSLEWRTFAWKIIRVWPDIVQNAGKTMHPSLFSVNQNTYKVALEKRLAVP